VTLAAVEHSAIVVPPERAELGVHALAQLPEDASLLVAGSLDPADPALRAARAYGVETRIGVAAVGDARRERERALTLAELVEGRGGRPPATYADGVLAGQRLAVVTNVPTHYRVALFNELARRAEAARASLRVFFLAVTPSTRAWMEPGTTDFEHDFLRGLDLSRDRGRRVIPLDLESRLRGFAPTTILVGGFSPVVAGRVARYARRSGVPFGVWSGELASRPTARQRLRRRQRIRLLGRAAYAVAYGSRAATYLRTLRDDLPIVIGRNTTVVPDPRTAPPRNATVDLLSVARAEPDKALDVLVDAVRRSPDLPCRLTVVGDGPELPALRGRASGDSRIRFLGAAKPGEVQRMLPAADVFLFPSRYDVFGLAVVEAMGAGLATVVSSLPGAVDDLCVSESNCLVVDGGPEDWATAIGRLVGDSELRVRVGAAAAETIHSRWTLEHAASAMLAGFRLAFLPSEASR
jgi:glycosyltransferase involved in cell wall biosynthesis